MPSIELKSRVSAIRSSVHEVTVFEAAEIVVPLCIDYNKGGGLDDAVLGCVIAIDEFVGVGSWAKPGTAAPTEMKPVRSRFLTFMVIICVVTVLIKF